MFSNLSIYFLEVDSYVFADLKLTEFETRLGELVAVPKREVIHTKDVLQQFKFEADVLFVEPNENLTLLNGFVTEFWNFKEGV